MRRHRSGLRHIRGAAVAWALSLAVIGALRAGRGGSPHAAGCLCFRCRGASITESRDTKGASPLVAHIVGEETRRSCLGGEDSGGGTWPFSGLGRVGREWDSTARMGSAFQIRRLLLALCSVPLDGPPSLGGLPRSDCELCVLDLRASAYTR